MGVSVMCPECGRLCLYHELISVPAPGFRWWLVPAFFLPAAVLVWMRELGAISSGAGMVPGIVPSLAPSIAVFVVLFALAWAAFRDQGGGMHRVGTAFVLAEFLWLTNALLAGLLPAL